MEGVRRAVLTAEGDGKRRVGTARLLCLGLSGMVSRRLMNVMIKYHNSDVITL